jgi:hypothetical protein
MSKWANWFMSKCVDQLIGKLVNSVGTMDKSIGPRNTYQLIHQSTSSLIIQWLVSSL